MVGARRCRCLAGHSPGDEGCESRLTVPAGPRSGEPGPQFVLMYARSSRRVSPQKARTAPEIRCPRIHPGRAHPGRRECRHGCRAGRLYGGQQVVRREPRPRSIESPASATYAYSASSKARVPTRTTSLVCSGRAGRARVRRRRGACGRIIPLKPTDGEVSGVFRSAWASNQTSATSPWYRRRVRRPRVRRRSPRRS